MVMIETVILHLDIAICGQSTIGDFVWFDYNNNGIQDAGEPGLPNVRVTITYEDGTTKTVRTDAKWKIHFHKSWTWYLSNNIPNTIWALQLLLLTRVVMILKTVIP
jgi:hypothetical protein